MVEAPVVRSQRGRRAREEQKLTPMQQIRTQAAGVTGAWCYYIRPDGATIRDALILSPNGGVPDENAVPNPRLRAAYATNSEVFKAAARAKGFIPLGQQLTEEGMAKLVEVLKENNEDEVLYCQEEIGFCEETISTTETSAVKDYERRRLRDFERRLEYVRDKIDPDAMIEELNEIAKAQQMRNVDPAVLRVMKTMLGEMQESLVSKMEFFQKGKVSEGEASGARGTSIAGGSTQEFDATGKDFIEVDDDN